MTQVKVVPLILAGKRSSDPLSQYFKLENKAFIQLAGKCMLEWVIEALQQTNLPEPYFISITSSQQAVFEERLKKFSCEFILNEEDESPVKASLKGLKLLSDAQGLLITTADNPLLRPDTIKQFLKLCHESSADLVIGTVNGKDKLLNKYPKVKRTLHKLNPNCWLSGTNLFYWSPKGLNGDALKTLCKLEEQRKSPLAFASIVAKLNLVFLLKLFLQKTNIEECSQALSKATNINMKLVTLSCSEACIDVDTLLDYELVESILNNK